MKQIKIGLAAICAIVGVTTFSAFKPVKKAAFATAFFQYTGTVFTAAAYNNSSNYENVGTTDPSCGATVKLCAIQAQSTSTGGKPILFTGFGTKVVSRQGHNTSTVVTSATTSITVSYQGA